MLRRSQGVGIFLYLGSRCVYTNVPSKKEFRVLPTRKYYTKNKKGKREHGRTHRRQFGRPVFHRKHPVATNDYHPF